MLLSATQWPALNASLNATSGALITAGFLFIRSKRVAGHRLCMMAACCVTALFFISYLSYHAQVGMVKFRGQGWIRTAYFSILISHTLLAITIVPLIIRTVWLATHNRIESHRRWARITFPLWLYVSATGVVVYWMLYRSRWSV